MSKLELHENHKSRKQQAILQSQMSAQELANSKSNSNEEIDHREPYKGTIIHIVTKGKKHFAALAMHKVTDEYDDKETVEKLIDEWGINIQLAATAAIVVQTLAMQEATQQVRQIKENEQKA